MASPIIGSPLSHETVKKLALIRDLINAGAMRPDPIQIAWAAGALKDVGELALARDYERIARRLMPQFRRDLT